MQRIKSVYILLLSIFILGGCKDDPKPTNGFYDESIVSTFYFIRHAEKDRSDPENEDPELNQAGLGRAMHWAEILDDIEMDAVYTTDYERTTMTAAPISVKKDLTVQYYDPELLDIEQFKADNLGNKVLVVGHSNSTPDLVNRMLGEERFEPMDDTDNGSLFIVQTINDQAIAQRLHFNCNCPKERSR